ncbi:MAG TPA: SCO family protein [Bacteroidetes bacterium]|nr:SCO family protein [Bacteroidota bacterium]HIL58533.1 SCO family protein [Rhodothermales bacterium]
MPRLLLLTLAAASLAACAAPASDPADLDAPLSDASVYQVDVAWGTDGGETVTLADLRGAPVALAMVYADCGTACPMIVHDMKQIGEAADVPLRYVLVTLDPARDTPEHLQSFRAMHQLGDDWTMLRGSDDDVRTLAAVLGVRYRFDADGTIAHSNLITLLDAGGDVVAQQEGLGTDPAPAVAALHTAL